MMGPSASKIHLGLGRRGSVSDTQVFFSSYTLIPVQSLYFVVHRDHIHATTALQHCTFFIHLGLCKTNFNKTIKLN